MDFTEIAHKVIKLSEFANTEYSDAMSEFEKKNGKCHDMAVLALFDDSTLVGKKQLLEYLKNLDEETLRDLLAVMYAGRGDSGTYDELRDKFETSSNAECIFPLYEKKPLPEYLSKGLRSYHPRQPKIDEISGLIL